MSRSEQKVKLISECFIKPNLKLVDEAEASKGPYHLGPMDLVMLSHSYMQKGLLYTKPCDHIAEVFLNKINHSFSMALLHFYPLAGRFASHVYPDEHSCCIFLDCAKGPGARFIHGSLDSRVSDILSSDDIHPAVKLFFDLGENTVNYDGHTKALLSVQVTELLDGFFIGFSVSHSVGDGTSLLHFITTMSEIFKSVTSSPNPNCRDPYHIPNKPIFKPLFPDGYGPILKLPFLKPDEFISRYDPGLLREKIFHFSTSSMSRLKSKANAKGSEISSFQALSALIWRAITRARKLDPSMETNVSLAMNARPRLNPPLSMEHFGNYFAGGKANCKISELLSNDLSWGAFLLHECVKNKDDRTIHEFLKKYCEGPFVGQPDQDSTFFGPNFVKIVGGPRTDFFGNEFGLGKPVAIHSGFGLKADGRVAASQGYQGVGSVDLEVSLLPSTMTALEVDEEFMSFVTFGKGV